MAQCGGSVAAGANWRDLANIQNGLRHIPTPSSYRVINRQKQSKNQHLHRRGGWQPRMRNPRVAQFVPDYVLMTSGSHCSHPGTFKYQFWSRPAPGLGNEPTGAGGVCLGSDCTLMASRLASAVSWALPLKIAFVRGEARRGDLGGFHSPPCESTSPLIVLFSPLPTASPEY